MLVKYIVCILQAIRNVAKTTLPILGLQQNKRKDQEKSKMKNM